MAEPKPHWTTDNAHASLDVLRGGIAIITGGASGIGLALAERSIAEGLHPVLADIEASAIDAAKDHLAPAAVAAGVDVLGVQVDVSSEDSVLALAEAVNEHHGDRPISLLCCNAGVGGGGAVTQASDVDWDFVLGVNVKGVTHCIRTFGPKMWEQDAAGSIMATASQDGLCAAQGVYGVSKHACVAMMEALVQELRGRLSVHVLCPNVVATNIVTSDRNRPERFGGPRQRAPGENEGANVIAERFKAFGMPPSHCADLVFEALTSGVFYVLAEAEDDPGYVRLEAETRMSAILDGTVPYRPASQLIAKVFDVNAPLPERARD